MNKSNRRRMYFFIAFVICLNSLLYKISSSVSEVVEEKIIEDDKSAKVIVNFSNIRKLKSDDVISIATDNGVIKSILGVNKKNNNDTYIYLEEGEYNIISSSGINDRIVINDFDDTYKINCDYGSMCIDFKKIIDVNEDSLSVSSIIGNDDTNSIISNDMDFSSDVVVTNLDYSNIKRDGFISQGYVLIDGTYPSILISSYSNNKNSRIYIYNREDGKYRGYISLDNRDHVGGITYDPDNDILFVTASGGLINTYDYSAIMRSLNSVSDSIGDSVVIELDSLHNDKNNNSIIISNDLNVLQSASTICFNNYYLYSIDYGLNSIVVRTEYDYINDQIVSLDNKVFIPEDARCVQGMAIYNDGDNDYLVVASSCGKIKSKLSVYEIDKSYNWKFINDKIINKSKMMEGISVDMYGNISSIYEGDITRSHVIGNVIDIINTDNSINYLNDFSYGIAGFYWDITHNNDLSLKKAKKYINKQK